MDNAFVYGPRVLRSGDIVIQQPSQHSRFSLARRLRLQQVVVFSKIVESGSILAASRDLAMTQPAISKSVHDLELQLGGDLFVRGKRGMSLTEFGVLFEKHTKNLLAELRYLAEDLNDWQAGTAGQVIVGTLISASATLLPQAITRLRRVAPDVIVTVQVGPNSTLFPALARGEIDVVVGVLPSDTSVIMRDSVERARLNHMTLYEEGLRVVAAPSNPLAQIPKIGLSDLHEMSWIVPTPDSVTYPAVRALFAREGLSMPRRLVESVSILTNLELVASSDMVGLMPQSAARRFAQAGLLAVLPLQELGVSSKVGYTVRSDRELSAAAQHFLKALHDAADLQSGNE